MQVLPSCSSVKYSQQNQQTLQEVTFASLTGFHTSTVRFLRFSLAKGGFFSSQLSQVQLKYPPHSSLLN